MIGLRTYIAGGLLLIAGAFGAIQTIRLDHAHARIADFARAELQATVEHQKALRKLEQDNAEAIAEIDRKYQKEADEAKHTTDLLLADVRSGTLKLRNKFVCPVGPSGTGSTPGAPLGAEGTVLSREDQEFLVRIAAEADDAIRERNEAVRIAEEDRRILREHAHD